MKRRLPRWSELRQVVQVEPPSLHRHTRALERASSLADIRRLARRRVPRSVFDYVDGGAEDEISLRASREAYARVRFRARVLRDVTTVDPTTSLFGQRFPLPILLGPTGFTRMMHHEGERAVAAAAAKAGVPYTLATVGTVSIEDVMAVRPAGPRWFQLYPPLDPSGSVDLIARAQQAGYGALVLTVDTAVAGARLRDSRHGLTVPPTLRLRTLADMGAHPRWWLNLLSTEPLAFANLAMPEADMGTLLRTSFNPGITLRDLDWMRRAWKGPLLVKGIQHPDDAVAVLEAGADAVVLSHHGGRQLDRATATLDLLPDVRAAVGPEATVLLDGGVTHGADAVAARALGADAVLVGRAYLYGLMAGGEAGVSRVLQLFDAQVRRTMALMGVTSLDELTPDQVTLD